MVLGVGYEPINYHRIEHKDFVSTIEYWCITEYSNTYYKKIADSQMKVARGAVLTTKKRKEYEVKIRFSSSKSISSSTFVQFNDFKIEKIPSTTKVQQFILKYKFIRMVNQENELEKFWLMKTVETEARMLLSFLSLVGRSKIEFKGATVNGVSTDVRRFEYIYPDEPPINITDLQKYYEKLSQIPNKDKKRFVNALRTYEAAIALMKPYPTVSFFLFVATVECLSNFKINKGRSGEKFVQFITNYLHPQLGYEKEELEKFQERLRTAYLIRNWFVHRGENVPQTVFLADMLQKKSAVYFLRKKELRAPGLVWLEKIVGGCLLGFLESAELKTSDKKKKPVFRTLAKKEGTIYLKKKKGIAIEKGQPITVNMLELD